MIVDAILRYISTEKKTIDEALCEEVSKLAKAIFKRQFMTEESECKLRMSSSGKCIRQLAYVFHGEPKDGKEIDSRAKLIFWAGDLTEMTLLGLAKVAGCPIFATGLSQLKLKMKLGEVEIEGHPDGIMLYKGEPHLVEVKSMSSFSFKRFEQGHIDDSYIMQVNFYMKHLGVKKCIFLAQNKDNGVIEEQVIDYDETIYTVGEDRLKAVVASTKDNLPPRPYKPDEKGFYSWRCAYCGWYNKCLVKPGLAKRVVVGNSYKIRAIKNEENVQQV